MTRSPGARGKHCSMKRATIAASGSSRFDFAFTTPSLPSPQLEEEDVEEPPKHDHDNDAHHHPLQDIMPGHFLGSLTAWANTSSINLSNGFVSARSNSLHVTHSYFSLLS